MEKKYAVFISLLITLIVAGNYLFFYDFEELEIVKIKDVLDGDTIRIEDGRVVRFLNINAEEKGRAFSSEAKSFLDNYLGDFVELDKEGVGSYGRTLGRIYFKGDYLNLKLVEEGLAHKYIVDNDELEDFKKAEEKARTEEKGMWKKSEHYGCLNVEINKKEEYVLITNDCGVKINDWTLKDESTRIYKLENVEEKEFKLFSGEGESKRGEFYWNRGKAWNDDKDSIFIRDEKGFLVYYDSYGY
jgi:endonuclease YncB( thermonuclease family)